MSDQVVEQGSGSGEASVPSVAAGLALAALLLLVVVVALIRRRRRSEERPTPAASLPDAGALQQPAPEATIVEPVAEALDSQEGYVPPTDQQERDFDRQLKSQKITGYHYVAEPAPGFDVEGLWHCFPCHGRSGYAAHAVALHTSLERLGMPTMLAPHPSMEIDIEQFPKDREEMLMRWLKTSVGIPRAYVASMPPDLRGAHVGTPSFVSYVAFEAMPVSQYAVQQCNDDSMTSLWCVSDFAARCYTSSGVNPYKVKVVPPAICDGPWKASLEEPHPERDKVSAESPFVFGALGTWHERKGFHHLVRAYFRSFRREDHVRLDIRTSYFGDKKPTLSEFEQSVMDEIAKIAVEFGDEDYPRSKKMPRIKLLTGTSLTDAETVRWLGGLDCFVNPSFGEGLGIPPIWAWAQGVPVVTSDFGAVGELALELRDRFGDESGGVFGSHRVRVPKEMLRHSVLLCPESEWGGYEPAALAGSMVAAFERGPCRSAPVGESVRRRFSFEETRAPLIEALSDIVPASLVEAATRAD